MNVVLGALALAAIGASGMAATRLADAPPGPRHLTSLWHLGAAILFGFGAYSAGFGLVLLTAGPQLWAIAVKDAVLLSIAATVLVVRRRDERDSERSAPAPGAPAWWLLLTGVAAVVAAAWVVHIRVVPDADWDAWMIWNMRARFLARAPEDVARAFAPPLAFSHTDYPLFVPGIVTSAWRLLGREPTWAPALVSYAIALATLCVVVGTVARVKGTAPAAIAGVVLLGVPFYAGQGSSQCADVPVSALVALAASSLALSAVTGHERRDSVTLQAGAAASLAAWTKNEGLLFFLAGCVVVSIVRLRPGETLGLRLRRVALFVTGGLPVLLLVLWFKWSLGVENDLVAGSTADTIASRVFDVERYVRIARAMAVEPFLVGKWNGLPVLLGICAVACRSRGVYHGAGVLCAWLGVVLAGFFAVYVLTPHDLEWHLVTSLDRLFVQLWPLGVLAAFMTMDERRPEPRGFSPADHDLGVRAPTAG